MTCAGSSYDRKAKLTFWRPLFAASCRGTPMKDRSRKDPRRPRTIPPETHEHGVLESTLRKGAMHLSRLRGREQAQPKAKPDGELFWDLTCIKSAVGRDQDCSRKFIIFRSPADADAEAAAAALLPTTRCFVLCGRFAAARCLDLGGQDAPAARAGANKPK